MQREYNWIASPAITTDTLARHQKEPRVRNSQHTPTAIRNISP